MRLRRLGEHPGEEAPGALGVPLLGQRAPGPVERHDTVPAIHTRLGKAPPVLGRAAHVARDPREQAQAPERGGGDLARRVARSHRAIGGRRLRATADVVESPPALVQRLGGLRLAAGRGHGVERDERLLGLARANEELAALELEGGPLGRRRERQGLLEGARRGLVPVELPGAVGDDAERAQDDGGLGSLGDDPFRLIDRDDRDLWRVAAQQPLGAIDPLPDRERCHTHARRLELREPVGGAVGVVARRYQNAEVAVGPRRELALAARLGRHSEEVERLGQLRRVRILVHEPSEQRLGLRVVAGAGGERRGEQERARRQTALAVTLGDARGHRARSVEIARLRERLGAEMADVVADRALLRRLAPELADERPRLALLVGRDRVRPRALDLGRDRRAGARRPGDGHGGRQEQRPEDDRAQHRHAA